ILGLNFENCLTHQRAVANLLNLLAGGLGFEPRFSESVAERLILFSMACRLQKCLTPLQIIGRFGILSNIPQPRNVRFTPDSGHSSDASVCPLSATSGHCDADQATEFDPD